MDARVRQVAALSLGNMGPEARGAVPALAQALRDERAEVSQAAVWALGCIGGPALPVLSEALTDECADLRRGAAGSLGRLGGPAVPPLTKALTDERWDVRRAAAQSLGDVGRKAQAAVPALAGALKDQNAHVREAAAGALGAIGRTAQAAVPALVGALQDDDAEVHETAVWALGEIRGNTEAGVPTLAEALPGDSYREATPGGGLEMLSLLRKRSVPLEDQLEVLAECGICLLEGVSPDAVLGEWSREQFERDPYVLLLTWLGDAPLASGVWHVDTECIDEPDSYVRVAERMGDLARGDLPLTEVHSNVDWDEERACLAFKLDDEAVRWEFGVDDDWIDHRVFSRFVELLGRRDTQRRYTYLDLQGQNALIGCCTPDELRLLNSKTGLKFVWLR